MNTYYTAKDIEELAGKGTRQLVLNPGVFLTDFARETAHQLGIEVVKSEKQTLTPVKPESSSKPTVMTSDKYNKPSGCQHASGSNRDAHSQASNSASQNVNGNGSKTMNQLVDLMGKAIKQGG